MMQATWKKLIVKLMIWLMAEMLLTFLGLDNLADYSEYLFSKEVILNTSINLAHEIINGERSIDEKQAIALANFLKVDKKLFI